MARLLMLAMLAALVALATPAAAAADDASLAHAYSKSPSATARDRAVRQFTRAFRAAARKRTHRRLVRALRASRRLARVTLRNRRVVRREDASSREGARARSLFLKGLALAHDGSLLAAHAVRAELKGHLRRARRKGLRAGRTLKHAGRVLVRGEKIMRAALDGR
jgi:hypothetical protein